MVSGLPNLIPLVLLPIIIVPGVVGLKIRLHVSHRTDSYGRLDSTVYSWTLSSISICLLYIWVYLATGSVDLIPGFLQAESISDLEITTIAGIYILHFIQCLAIGAFIGSFAYNYVDPPRLSVRETKRDLIFKYIGRGSDVEIRTEDGDTIRGYVGKSFNRGKGEGVILSGPERVCGPEVDGEKHTEDMGQYALVKESDIAHVSVESEGIDPEKTKDDPDKFQNLIYGIQKELFPSNSLGYLFSPPRRFFTYSLYILLSAAIMGFSSSVAVTYGSSISPASPSFETRILVVFLFSLFMLWLSNQQVWATLVSSKKPNLDKLSAIKSSLVILIPVMTSTSLLQSTGISRIKSLSTGCLISCSAVYLGLKYRSHSYRAWNYIGDSEFYYFSIVSLTSQIFFLLSLAIFGRSMDVSGEVSMNIDYITPILSIIIIFLLFIIFMGMIDGGPSKKRPLSNILYTPSIIIFETFFITILLIFAIRILFDSGLSYTLLAITGLVYSIGLIVSNIFAYVLHHYSDDKEKEEQEPPQPAF